MPLPRNCAREDMHAPATHAMFVFSYDLTNLFVPGPVYWFATEACTMSRAELVMFLAGSNNMVPLQMNSLIRMTDLVKQHVRQTKSLSYWGKLLSCSPKHVCFVFPANQHKISPCIYLFLFPAHETETPCTRNRNKLEMNNNSSNENTFICYFPAHETETPCTRNRNKLRNEK
jgi:hypothetical protein